jgi:hypothetical protein
MTMASRARRVFATAALIAFLVTGLPVATPRASGAERAGLEYLGTLPRPHDAEGQPLWVSAIDAPNRRAYAHYWSASTRSERLVEYDLDKPVNRMLLRDAEIPSSPNASFTFNTAQVTIDSSRRLAWYLDWGPDATDVGVCQPQSLVRSIDLKTLKAGPYTWDLNRRLPGFYPQGITYSARDRRIYLIGVMGCEDYVANQSPQQTLIPVVPVTIVSLDADTGSLAWSATLTKCLHAMTIQRTGTSIYRSQLLPALYVGCIRTDTDPFIGLPYPGESGIDRIWIPAAGDTVVRPREEFFGISGNFQNTDGTLGQFLYDARAERLFAATHSKTTPGAWVFDGRMSAWVGFVPALGADNSPIGIDQSTGHFFMKRGEDPQRTTVPAIIVSDARQTPVPQGKPFDVTVPTDGRTWVVDPVRHIVFAYGVTNLKGSNVSVTLVLQDRTPVNGSPSREDYDALTSDLPEGPSTLTTYSGTVAGYGANIVYVGGLGGATAPLYQNGFTSDGNIVPRNSLVSPGDRGATIASVPFLDLRNVGSSASAQQIAPDTSTDNDRRTTQTQLVGEADQVGLGDAGAQVAGLLDWRWPSSACLDPGGTPTDPSSQAPGGQASAHCNLDKLQASASAAEGVVQTEGLTIASSLLSSSAVKDRDGLVTTNVALVRGIVVDVPGQGTLRIGSVRLEVRTTAHGHPGTAEAPWSREIKDAAITDAQGKEQFSCVVCDPEAFAKQVNDLFDLKLRVRVPTPQVTQTARGAFAGFEENDADHVNNVVAMNESNSSRIMPALVLEIYNDLQDRSRILVQLAGIQANSIYGISPLPVAPPVIPNPVLPTIAPLPQPSLPIPPPRVEPPARGGGGIFHRVVTTARFLVRSPKDALLVGLTGLLCGAMAAVTLRRRRLNALTVGGGS